MMTASPDYLEKQWENRLNQAIKLANVMRDSDVHILAVVTETSLSIRRQVEQIAGTGLRSEATWRMAIKIATEVK